MERITFERVNPRATYTHFVEENGDIIALSPLGGREVKVGIVFDQEFPTDQQRQAMAHLANMATGYDPTVELVFKEGTSPFPGMVMKNHPLADCCT